jgi:hypothetical protein
LRAMDAATHWAEFYGGPWDGAMVKLPWGQDPSTPCPLVIVRDPGVYTVVEARDIDRMRGRYERGEWADEELGIVRWSWGPVGAD